MLPRLLLVLPFVLLAACERELSTMMDGEAASSAAIQAMQQASVQWDKAPAPASSPAAYVEIGESYDSAQAESAGPPVQAQAEYVMYRDGVIGGGQRAVLFFAASWCPNCSVADGQLLGIYGEGAARISTYKVNFDEALDLRKRYGVTYQHTFVIIDGAGNAERVVQGPTEADLRTILGS